MTNSSHLQDQKIHSDDDKMSTDNQSSVGGYTPSTQSDSDTVSDGRVIYTPSTTSDENMDRSRHYTDEESGSEAVSLLNWPSSPKIEDSPHGASASSSAFISEKDPEALWGEAPTKLSKNTGNQLRDGKRETYCTKSCCGGKSRRRRMCSFTRASFIVIKVAFAIALLTWLLRGTYFKNRKVGSVLSVDLYSVHILCVPIN